MGTGASSSEDEPAGGGGGGVCYLVMPKGCRGTEAALLAAGRAAGLRWDLAPLRLRSPRADSADEGCKDEDEDEAAPWDDDFWLHTVRIA